MRKLAATILLLAALGSLGLVACGDSGSDTTVTITKTEKSDGGGSSKPSKPPSQARFASYTASLYRARVPAGWKLEKDEVSRGDFVRSQWRHPSGPNTSVLIDAVEDEGETPEQKAQDVRDATSGTPGYREVSFGPTTIGGLDAYKWVFVISGDQRVDYFTNECGVGIAALGSTSPSDFASYASVFRRVAKSIRSECPTEAPPPSSPEEDGDGEAGCLSEYPDVCVPDDGYDYDCDEVDGSDFSVPGDDPMGFDADQDGVGCESY